MADGTLSPAVTRAIKRVITESGLPVSEIARRLADGNKNARRSQVQKWRRGATGITVESARALERACGAEPGVLVNIVAAEEAKAETKRLRELQARQREQRLREIELRRTRALEQP